MDGADFLLSIAAKYNITSDAVDELKAEFDARLQDNVDSASAVSKRSSRKRAREVGWEDIFTGTDMSIPMDEFITPEHFSTMTEMQQRIFLRCFNLEDRLKLVQVMVAECLSMKPVPSPSNMKWAQIDSILERSEHKVIQGLDAEPPPAVKLDVDTLVRMLREKFRNHSEMEVVIRIYSLILCVIADLPNVSVTLQPSEYGHTCFTDFLIEITNGNSIRRFIEVKKPTIMVDLSEKTDETAQALREAHIMLQKTQEHTTTPFLLTNGTVFSFGIVSKTATTKIRLEAVTNILCNLKSSKGWKDAMRYIKAYITGTWPTTMFPQEQ